ATWGMSFRRGVPGVFDGDGPNAKFSKQSGLHKLRRIKKGVTGTRVRFWPDRRIFTKDAVFGFDELVTRARQTSFLVPGLEVIVRDERGQEPLEERFRHEGGIAEYCEFLAPDEPVTPVIRLQGGGHFTETVPVLDENGHMDTRDVERDLSVDIAVRWGTGYETEMRSFVNVIATPKGGTHVQGFERALSKTFNDVLRGTRMLRSGEADVIKDDILEGMTAVITVRLAEPQF